MKIITVANQKGGCAKTTTVVNLAAALVEKGKKVLVIDFDPQCNATVWLGQKNQVVNIVNCLLNDRKLSAIVHQTRRTGLCFIPGSEDMRLIDWHLNQANFDDAKVMEILSSIRLLDYDFVLIDTPPTLGRMTQFALETSDYLLVPVAAQVMSLYGVVQLVNLFNERRAVTRGTTQLLGVLATRVDWRTKHAKDVVASIEKSFDEKCFKTRISECVKLAEAPSFQVDIFEYAPNSKSVYEFRSLAEEIILKTSCR